MTKLLFIILGVIVALIAKEYLYDDRHYYTDFKKIEDKEHKLKCCTKVLKNEVQCKCKPTGVKKKIRL